MIYALQSYYATLQHLSTTTDEFFLFARLQPIADIDLIWENSPRGGFMISPQYTLVGLRGYTHFQIWEAIAPHFKLQKFSAQL